MSICPIALRLPFDLSGVLLLLLEAAKAEGREIVATLLKPYGLI
jgi:hypothetical protein